MVGLPHDGESYVVLPGNLDLPLVLTCEHAANALPEKCEGLGLEREQLDEHWAWDLGAWATALRIASRLRATIIGSLYSRLLVDLNRDLSDPTLIVEALCGQPIPGNQELSPEQRAGRIATYYEPYHAALEQVCSTYTRAHGPRWALVSIHSFTPSWPGQDRDFDIGVLFDDANARFAESLIRTLSALGPRVRANEPYSGRRGEIYSVARHGGAAGVPYLELELNQASVGTEQQRRQLGDILAEVLPEVCRKACAEA